MNEFVMVTGGAGYIGSIVSKLLLQSGYRVLLLDNLSTGHYQVYTHLAGLFGAERLKFIKADLADAEALTEVFAAHRITGIIDFAASIVVPESQHQPRNYFNNNVRAFNNLIQAAGGLPLVKSSTAAIYGEPGDDDIPIAEDLPQRIIAQRRFNVSQLKGAAASFREIIDWYEAEIAAGSKFLALDNDDYAFLQIQNNVYGITKGMDEILLQKYYRHRGYNYVALRYFNAAGAEAGGNLGEDHNPETHLIPIVLQTMLGLRPKLSVYGDDYPTRDGTCIRDYVSVNDLARAHVAALEHLRQGRESQILNLGTSKGYSIKELLTAAREITGVEIAVEISPRRAGDTATLVADSSALQAAWGITASESLFDTITNAWRWHKSHPGGYGN